MTRDESVRMLIDSTNKIGLIHTLHEAYGSNIKVEIRISTKSCNQSIDEINFSVRSLNALKRASLFTVGDVIQALSTDHLLKIRNLGKKSLNEIKTKILAFSFEKLSSAEQEEFFSQIIVLNSFK